MSRLQVIHLKKIEYFKTFQTYPKKSKNKHISDFSMINHFKTFPISTQERNSMPMRTSSLQPSEVQISCFRVILMSNAVAAIPSRIHVVVTFWLAPKTSKACHRGREAAARSVAQATRSPNDSSALNHLQEKGRTFPESEKIEKDTF